MATSDTQVSQDKEKTPPDLATQELLLKKTEFVITTYPDLQPFLEMMVLLLEGVFEHALMTSQGAKN